jgi:hypothetical protein
VFDSTGGAYSTVFALQHSFFWNIDPPSAVGILESNRSASGDLVNKDVVHFVLRWFSDITKLGSFDAQRQFSRIPVRCNVDGELKTLENFYDALSCPHSFILEFLTTSSSLETSTLMMSPSTTPALEPRMNMEKESSSRSDRGKEETESEDGIASEKLQYGTGRWCEYVDLQRRRQRVLFRKIFVDSHFSAVHSACLEQWICEMNHDDLFVLVCCFPSCRMPSSCAIILSWGFCDWIHSL